MSSRRERASEISDNEINDLIAKLRALLPDSGGSKGSGRVPPTKMVEEICSYIRRLHQDVGDISEKVSQLLNSVDINSIDADTIRNQLLQ